MGREFLAHSNAIRIKLSHTSEKKLNTTRLKGGIEKFQRGSTFWSDEEAATRSIGSEVTGYLLNV
ncbi:hypothetical protein HZS_7988 [Henneguya salminicola]|nr:hypothetical protein HZS_7988 [Henneguya salminicola]